MPSCASWWLLSSEPSFLRHCPCLSSRMIDFSFFSLLILLVPLTDHQHSRTGLPFLPLLFQSLPLLPSHILTTLRHTTPVLFYGTEHVSILLSANGRSPRRQPMSFLDCRCLRGIINFLSSSAPPSDMPSLLLSSQARTLELLSPVLHIQAIHRSALVSSCPSLSVSGCYSIPENDLTIHHILSESLF